MLVLCHVCAVLCVVSVIIIRVQAEAMTELSLQLKRRRPRVCTALALAALDAVLKKPTAYPHVPMLRRLLNSLIYAPTDADGLCDLDFQVDYSREAAVTRSGGRRGSLNQRRAAAYSKVAQYVRQPPCFEVVAVMEREVEELVSKRSTVEDWQRARTSRAQYRLNGVLVAFNIHEKALTLNFFTAWRAVVTVPKSYLTPILTL